jgi:hypothetical protein
VKSSFRKVTSSRRHHEHTFSWGVLPVASSHFVTSKFKITNNGPRHPTTPRGTTPLIKQWFLLLAM